MISIEAWVLFAEMKGNGNDMENDNKLVRNGCKEMHGVWIRTLAVKNGYGNVMLYGCTIGGIQNLFRKGGGT